MEILLLCVLLSHLVIIIRKALLNNDWSRGLVELQTEYLKYKAIWDAYGVSLGYSGEYVFTVAFASTHLGDRKLGTTVFMIAGLS